MEKMCNSCDSCGMPLTKAQDCALGDFASRYCRHCTDEKGERLPFESILQCTAKFYVDSQDLHHEAAMQMAREMLLEMKAWRQDKK
jgi:hypothetical protein